MGTGQDRNPNKQALMLQIMMGDIFDVFLDSVCKYFIGYFCINVHEGNWSAFLFVEALYDYGYQRDWGLIKYIWQYSFGSILYNNLRSISINSPLKVW